MDSLIGEAIAVLIMITGRLAVRMFSLGRWRADPIWSDEGLIYSAAGALSYTRDGGRIVTHTGQLFAGIAFYAALVLGILYAVAV